MFFCTLFVVFGRGPMNFHRYVAIKAQPRIPLRMTNQRLSMRSLAPPFRAAFPPWATATMGTIALILPSLSSWQCGQRGELGVYRTRPATTATWPHEDADHIRVLIMRRFLRR